MKKVEVIELYRRGVARNFFKCGPTNFFPSKMNFSSKLDSFGPNSTLLSSYYVFTL